jgi:hypothetical protein
MPRVTVDADVELDDFDTEDLIEELESRDFVVLENDDPILKSPVLEKDEILALISLIDSQAPLVGSELYFIRDKLFCV